jgi:hypothetical protein
MIARVKPLAVASLFLLGCHQAIVATPPPLRTCVGAAQVADWPQLEQAMGTDKLFSLARGWLGEPATCSVNSSGADENRTLIITYAWAGGSNYKSENLPPENVHVHLTAKVPLADEAKLRDAIAAEMGSAIDWSKPADDGSGKPPGPDDMAQYDVEAVNGQVNLTRRGAKIVEIDYLMNL